MKVKLCQRTQCSSFNNGTDLLQNKFFSINTQRYFTKLINTKNLLITFVQFILLFYKIKHIIYSFIYFIRKENLVEKLNVAIAYEDNTDSNYQKSQVSFEYAYNKTELSLHIICNAFDLFKLIQLFLKHTHTIRVCILRCILGQRCVFLMSVCNLVTT